MPVKRRTSKQRRAVNEEAVRAYRDGDAPALHRALGLKPWETSPIDAVGPCQYPAGTGGAESWGQAVELRKQLEKAVAA